LKRLGDGFVEAMRAAVRRSREVELTRRPDGDFWCQEHKTVVPTSNPVLSCDGCVLDADRRAVTEGRLERVRGTWKGVGLPAWPWARLGATSWQQKVSDRVVNAATSWTPGRSLFVAGPTGCGKTSVMVARMHDLLARAYRWARDPDDEGPCPVAETFYVTEPRLVASRRNRPLGEGESPMVARAMSVPVLILDEIGSMSSPVTFEVVDERFMSGLPTVALTGFSADELSRRVGAHCFRRLYDHVDKCDLFAEVPCG
jgi:hypothetical protein